VISRGDIRWFRFQTPDKRRPVLVLGPEDAMSSLSQIPVIPLSTQARGLPWEVRLTANDGVPTECVLKPEWIRAVDRTLIGPYIASLPDGRWPEVRIALLSALGFDS
jgi:mRNA-degrading endonuclease toxin of MazEF toxin-antitoxin module